VRAIGSPATYDRPGRGTGPQANPTPAAQVSPGGPAGPSPTKPTSKGRWWATPFVALMLMSPFVGELLSGSSPPLEFLNPFSLFFLVGLYGCGAVLIREATHRWGKGWPTLVALGIAYGIVEEALMVKSWFDPGWMDLGDMAWYGRWWGTNWVWAEGLTIFHAVFSIYISIALVDVMFPARRHERWVSDRTLVLLLAWISFVTVLGALFMSGYRPGTGPYVLAVVAAVALIALAWRLPVQLWHPRASRTPTPGGFYLLGAIWGTVFFLAFFSSPSSGLPAVAVMALMAVYTLVGFLVVLWTSGGGENWTDRHRLAFAGGALTFLLFLDFAIGIGNPASLMLLAGIAGIALLAWEWRRLGTDHPSPHQGRLD